MITFSTARTRSCRRRLPMITPTAMSTTLPFMANSLNSDARLITGSLSFAAAIGTGCAPPCESAYVTIAAGQQVACTRRPGGRLSGDVMFLHPQRQVRQSAASRTGTSRRCRWPQPWARKSAAWSIGRGDRCAVRRDRTRAVPPQDDLLLKPAYWACGAACLQPALRRLRRRCLHPGRAGISRSAAADQGSRRPLRAWCSAKAGTPTRPFSMSHLSITMLRSVRDAALWR